MKKQFIALCMLSLILASVGCSGSQTYQTVYYPSDASTTAQTPASTPPTTTPTTLPLATAPISTAQLTTSAPPSAAPLSKYVEIGYSATQATQIGTGSYPSTPKPGNIYEIVTYTIVNNGYDSFSVNPFYFDIIVNSIKYGYSSDSYSLPGSMTAVSVMKGGTLICALAFEIPAGSTSFTPSYNDMFGSYNIKWVGLSAPPPATTSSPSSTSSSKYVEISYSGVQATQIGTGSYPSTPKPGYIYEIVTYTIVNNGYDSFSVNPFDFDIIVNSIKYGYSSTSYSLPGSMTAVSIMKGGRLVCALAFEIPVGSTNFTPSYDDTFGLYDIRWVAK